MATAKKPTKSNPPAVALSKTVAAVLDLSTVQALKLIIEKSIEHIEDAEATAPTGIVKQHCQLAKVRVSEALEILEAWAK